MTQSILITAGAGGIGLATALSFARNGARVHICDVNADALNAVTSTEAAISGTLADVSSEDDVERLFEDVAAALGGLDVLVNNAGVSGPTTPVEDFGLDDWQSVMRVNLDGTFMVTRRAIPLLKQSDAASIIIMSSVAGRYGYANRSPYSTSKWGLVGFAKTLALELGEFGITCNTIHPGAVEGERISRVFEGRSALSGRSIEEERALGMENQSIKRFTDPNDIAELIRFLTGPHGRTISGQIFPIDGDSKAAQ